jgi:hypothetical protein
VETISVLPLLILAALIAVQLQLFVSTASDAENAARNASRAVRAGDDAYEAARASLSGAVRDRLQPSHVGVGDERVTVRLQVPIVVDQLSVGGFSVTRDAQLPSRD